MVWLQKREQERLEKMRQMEHTDALAALEHFTQYQKSKEESLAQRMDQVQDNRERKLREAKEKQERRRRHAEEVRKRKALARESGVGESCQGMDAETLTPRPEMTPAPGVNPTSEVSAPDAAELARSPVLVQEARERSDSGSSGRGGSGRRRE